MSSYLVDTNVISRILKGDLALGEALSSVDVAIDATIYIECIQGSKSNSEKRLIKGFLDAFPVYFSTLSVSRLSTILIEQYSNSNGLLLGDAQIAAACIVNGFDLLSFNLKDFQFIKELKVTEPNQEWILAQGLSDTASPQKVFGESKGDFEITTDRSRLDLGVIHHFLSEESYWAQNRTLEQTKNAIENSLCFGLYQGDVQIGFARVVSDLATFAYLGDVFVLEEFRGRGLSKWLMQTIVEYPDLQGLRRWVLATQDAHGLYEQFEFAPLRHPDRWMEKTAPDAY